MNSHQTTNIIIAALGGEGGGVLAQWITDVATSQGYLAQSTSVPGVAQRTGATIYYLELFPKSSNCSEQPVMSLFPTQGDIDIVIASEIIEAGRMVQRGFVTPNRTTLITSDHRVYTIGEKLIPGNGIVDADEVRKIAKAKSQRLIHDDMKALALAHNTIISATLFGALAGSATLPFPRKAFEDIIQQTGKAVNANLGAFAASFNRVVNATTSNTVEMFTPSLKTSQAEDFQLPQATTANGEQLLDRIANEFKSHSHEFLYLGVKRLLAYQDADYANQYLDHLRDINTCEYDNSGILLRETARYLALWMSYEDIIRVAQIKISPQRFERLGSEINIEPGQHYNIVEYLRPQLEEYIAILPPCLAKSILKSSFWQKFIGHFTKGKLVSTNKLSGFLQFYLLSKLKPLRKNSWGYQCEHTQINRWLSAIKLLMKNNYPIAVEIAKCARLIKGYGNTRKRGQHYLSSMLEALDHNKINQAEQIAKIREIALSDTTEKKALNILNAIAS